jgi:hypothetical protein
MRKCPICEEISVAVSLYTVPTAVKIPVLMLY